MSEGGANGGSSVFPNATERDKAIRMTQRENPSIGPAFKNNSDETILSVAQTLLNYSLPGCNGKETCDSTRENGQRQTEAQAQMTAVPGRMNCNIERHPLRQRDDSDEYPAGGRRSWERRKVGLNGVPEGTEVPAGSRSAWEARKTKERRPNGSSDADDDLDLLTGSQSAYQQR